MSCPICFEKKVVQKSPCSLCYKKICSPCFGRISDLSQKEKVLLLYRCPFCRHCNQYELFPNPSLKVDLIPYFLNQLKKKDERWRELSSQNEALLEEIKDTRSIRLCSLTSSLILLFSFLSFLFFLPQIEYKNDNLLLNTCYH